MNNYQDICYMNREELVILRAQIERELRDIDEAGLDRHWITNVKRGSLNYIRQRLFAIGEPVAHAATQAQDIDPAWPHYDPNVSRDAMIRKAFE